MEKFEVTILGCGCAVPTLQHRPAAQIVNIREKLSLIDCGEGTQLQLRRFKIGLSKIRNIFISHLHGDHCLGLMGLISSLSLLGRTSELHVYAPGDYETLFQEELDFFCKGIEFKVVFHAIDTTRHHIIYEDRSATIYTLPLTHRVPCCGFLFKEKPTLPHIIRDMIDFHEIPLCEINNIKLGADWIKEDGTIVPNSRLTKPSYTPRSYAYCSDTIYKPDLAPLLEGTTLLYHEATFGNERLERARKTLHSTASQAAAIARDCHAQQLLIGHFSAQYTDETALLEEARSVFPNTIAANEGLTIHL